MTAQCDLPVQQNVCICSERTRPTWYV